MTPEPPEAAPAPPADVPPTPAPVAAAPPADPAARRKLIKVLAIAGGAALLVIIAVVAIFSVQGAAHAPQARVSSYLDALVAGRADQAMLEVDGAAQSPFISNAVYSRADNRVTRYTILDSTETGTSAQVTVDVTTRSGGWTDVLQLIRTGSDGPFAVWKIDGRTLPTVETTWYAPEGFGLAVNGVELDPDVMTGHTTFAVLPGLYEVTQATPNGIYQVAPTQLDIPSFVASGAPEQLNAAVTLTDEGATSANRALRNFLDKCIQQKRAAPTGNCGFKVTTGGKKYTKIKWTIVTRPTADYAAYDGTGWQVITTRTGTFKFRGENSRYIGKATIKGYEYVGYITFDGDVAIFTSGYENN